MLEQSAIQAAARRPNGPGRIVWLASYPKSGNTWMRAIITALGIHKHFFSVNQLGSGSQPYSVRGALWAYGLDPRWLSFDEIDRLRSALIERTTDVPADWEGPGQPPPILRKTHEVFRAASAGREPFPRAATRAAILIVRDPRDVACSYAPFFGVDLDAAVDALGREKPPGNPSPANGRTAQPWGTWSSHVMSWLADDVGFPVHLVRYEDLKADAAGTLLPIVDAVGVGCTHAELQHAVEMAAFDRLKESEAQRGFRETSKSTLTFFRKGQAGGWRTELTPGQVAAIEADHGEVMALLGYPMTTGRLAREALSESRRSRRRAEQRDWIFLPESLGIAVRRGAVPQSLENAQRPRPWIQITQRQALLRFRTGAGLLVEDGQQVTVDWDLPADGADDPSWLLQGWAVTLAMLQRGRLSLHAATVRINGAIVAIAGHRGAGKSTTAMALRQRGHDLLVDDVTLIDFRDGAAWTTPYARNVHLLPDAAEAVGVDFDALPLLAGGRKKVAFRSEEPAEEPQRIDHIVVISPHQNVDAVTMKEVRGSARLKTLMGHTRRDGIAPMVLGHERFFALLALLSDSVDVNVLYRPATDWSMNSVLESLETLRARQIVGDARLDSRASYTPSK